MAYDKKALLTDVNGRPIPQYYDSATDQFLLLNGVQDVVLQENATAISNGKTFVVGAVKTITIEITGTSTSRTIVFEASSVSGAYYPIQGTKLQDFTLSSQTSGLNELWVFDVTGLMNFRTRISDISGGSVNVRGKAVI